MKKLILMHILCAGSSLEFVQAAAAPTPEQRAQEAALRADRVEQAIARNHGPAVAAGNGSRRQKRTAPQAAAYAAQVDEVEPAAQRHRVEQVDGGAEQAQSVSFTDLPQAVISAEVVKFLDRRNMAVLALANKQIYASLRNDLQKWKAEKVQAYNDLCSYAGVHDLRIRPVGLHDGTGRLDNLGGWLSAKILLEEILPAVDVRHEIANLLGIAPI